MSAASLPSGPSLKQTLETLAIGATGGTIFGLSGMPAGWLSGAMLFVASAALGGRPVGVPVRLARVIFVLVGTSIGAVVTPETLRGIASWPLSIAVLAVAMLFATVATVWYLRVVHRWDLMSSYFASVPGLLTQVLVMASQTHADLRGVAIVQTVRVVILAVGVPTGLAMLGLVGPPPVRAATQLTDSLAELALLIVPSALGAIIAHAVRFPASWLLGSMIVSGFLHGAGIVHVTLPWWVVAAAMCGLGSMTGSRFANMGMRLLLAYLGAALGSFVVSVVVTGVFVAGLVALAGFHPADVVVSFAPGGLDVMMILALTMHLDPVFVGAHHLARFLVISVSMPLAVRLIRRQLPPPPASNE